MSTDVAVRGDARDGLAIAGSTASLIEWAAELDAAHRLANALCQTSFVPRHFQGKPLEGAAAILTGKELGLSPMASLRSVFIIGGTPSMYAKAMVAVVQSQGHDVWVEEQSDERVVVCGRRKGTNHVARTVWDRARVVKAKLTSNAKYQENPQQMMVARGQAEIARQVGADALLGVPYAVEELDDFSPDAPIVTTATAGRVTAAEILADAAPPPEEPTPPALAEPEPDTITQSQSRKMFALLKEKGYADKDAALAFIAIIIGREITSRAELTKAEAGEVIDRLEALGMAEAVEEDALWPTVAGAE